MNLIIKQWIWGNGQDHIELLIIYNLARLKYHVPMEKKTISLLLLHGSARKSAIEAATEMVDTLSLQFSCHNFLVCFLRGAVPDLSTAMLDAVSLGAKRIQIIPLLILPGAHVDEDIPAEVAKFNAKHPEIEIEINNCLVKDNEFLNLVASKLHPWTEIKEKAEKQDSL